MSKYIPTPAYPDSMPVDISFVFENEKPAGKRGFLKAQGDHFYFEDGTQARFWGVNFNGGANFPEHDYAEKVARRLAQAGCNIARFHQLDAQWDTPNIYAYTKGKRLTTTRVLDPVSMDRLDYLIYCLKREGIYCYMDMMTYRRFKSGDGVPYVNELADSAKPFSIFNRRLIDLQKEFCDQFWNHYNPYTQLLNKDDPVFVMTEITNECDMFNLAGVTEEKSPHYFAEMRQIMQNWMDANGYDFDCINGDVRVNISPVAECKMALTRAYYKEMYDHMRALGVKIPITGTNWYHLSNCTVVTEDEMDFADSHLYYYDWRWGEEDKFCANEPINGNRTTIQKLALSRLNNRPFFVSEWDMPWPNSYRAEGPIYYAAVCALQDWSGMAIHTYSYGTKMDKMDILGKELSCESVAGIPYRTGIFSTWNDPAKFGLFYHAALMIRRGDMKPANKKLGVKLPFMDRYCWDLYLDTMEVHRMAVVPDGEEAVGCDEVLSVEDRRPWENPNVVCADNGQMWRDLAKKVGGIDTPRTKVVYGKLAAGRNDSMAPIPGTEVDGLQVKGKTDFGVIALSSLTDDSIETTDNMLLTTIGRARNTDQVYDGDKLIDYGKAPILSEVIRAEISIRTQRTDLQVWGVNPEGFYVGQIPAKYEDGMLTFTVGEKWAASYYLIVAE